MSVRATGAAGGAAPGVRAFRCVRCGRDHDAPPPEGCPACAAQGARANCYAVYGPDARAPAQIRSDWQRADRRGVWRFADRLPALPSRHQIELGEGGTPLVPLRRLGGRLGRPRLFLKDESQCPTGSWKDRFMAVAVSHALATGAPALAAASSGNAGASLAAYAARAGLPAHIFCVAGVPPPLVAQICAHGARVCRVATREARFDAVRRRVRERGWYSVSNFCQPPVGGSSLGVEGYKTIAFELAEAFDFSLPEIVVVPTCYGDGLLGIWRGLVELAELGLCATLPRLVAARPAGAPTVAFSLGAPKRMAQIDYALRESGGRSCDVAEDEIVPMQRRLARDEGVFHETATAVALCALDQLDVGPQERIVVIGTATGLKQAHAAPGR